MVALEIVVEVEVEVVVLGLMLSNREPDTTIAGVLNQKATHNMLW